MTFCCHRFILLYSFLLRLYSSWKSRGFQQTSRHLTLHKTVWILSKDSFRQKLSSRIPFRCLGYEVSRKASVDGCTHDPGVWVACKGYVRPCLIIHEMWKMKFEKIRGDIRLTIIQVNQKSKVMAVWIRRTRSRGKRSPVTDGRISELHALSWQLWTQPETYFRSK